MYGFCPFSINYDSVVFYSTGPDLERLVRYKRSAYFAPSSVTKQNVCCSQVSMMKRPNKLECLSLETLSSQVFEFEGKA
jgi:hypothetical protein